jgi:hypothetical protein
MESGSVVRWCWTLVELTRTAADWRILERLGFLQRASEFSPQAESFAKWRPLACGAEIRW